MPRDIHNIYVEFYTLGTISTQHVYLPLASWLHQVRCLCFYLHDLSNIFQYDLMTHLNKTFCIRLFEAFCIRLIEPHMFSVRILRSRKNVNQFRNRSSSFSVGLPRSACAIVSIVSVYMTIYVPATLPINN